MPDVNIYSIALQTRYVKESNTMNPELTTPNRTVSPGFILLAIEAA